MSAMSILLDAFDEAMRVECGAAKTKDEAGAAGARVWGSLVQRRLAWIMSDRAARRAYEAAALPAIEVARLHSEEALGQVSLGLPAALEDAKTLDHRDVFNRFDKEAKS